MAKEDRKSKGQLKLEDSEESESLELVLFHVPECYVYMIPPRKTAASYRADEWNVNKWDWEGILKVVSKGEECIIRLEDKKTGELYARAFLRKGEPHPVETVIDSSRYFVVRVEENIGGRLRHAFIGIGFRERTEAYDFQAALHDHMKYLNKKEAAEEMEQQYQNKSTVDYSLKDGEKLVLQIKNQNGRSGKSKNFEQSMNNLSLEEKSSSKDTVIGLKPPPPPQAVVSPTAAVQRLPPFQWTESFSPKKHPQKNEAEDLSKEEHKVSDSRVTQTVKEDLPDDDFGDFQTAG